MVLMIVGIGIVLLVIVSIFMYNRLVSLQALVKEAWSGIDVQLKRRYDLIPNLIATVKQYGLHEKEILEKIATMRASSMQASTVQAKSEAETGLTQTLRTLFAVVENYPQLKANENFMALQKSLSDLEQDIQLSRRYYNGATRNYNIAVTVFPSNLVAGVTGFQKEAYFEIPTTERETPRVSF